MLNILYKFLDTILLFLPYKSRAIIRKLSNIIKRKAIKVNNLKIKTKVIKKIKEKIKNNQKINVAFLVFNESKWKNESIYNILKKSEHFTPYIFVTKKDVPKDSFDYETNDKLKETYNFFKNKDFNVFFAYDIEKDNWISLDKMNPKPDIVYYCEPWAIHSSQYPISVNNYALTYYSPYFIPTSNEYIEYGLDFHNDVQTYFVQNKEVKNEYSKKMKNEGENLVIAGHPTLDYFFFSKDKEYENKNTIIYAPHHSVDNNSILRWGTFLENADFILNWAKNHPEFKYIFKPHPSLKGYLLKYKLKTEEYVNNYWQEWNKIGLTYESGNYLDMFSESKALISDCGSFKTEYFMTLKPQIYLKNRFTVPFNVNVEKICDTCYIANNINELDKILDEVLIKNNDYKKEERLNLYQQLDYASNYCAKNILDNIEKTLDIK